MEFHHLQTTEILYNPTLQGKLKMTPTDQSSLAWLIKENNIWKNDYYLHIKNTNQTTIIGLNNKTLEEDYYSLTQEPIKQQRMTLPKPNNYHWFGQQDTWEQEIPNQEGPFDPSYGIKGRGRDSIKDCNLSPTMDLNGIPSSPNISIPSNGIQAME